MAAIPDDLPFKSNGHQHVAVNLTTGHRIPCADAYMATGYVAASAVLFPLWVFVLEMGTDTVKSIKAHPLFISRMKNPNWAKAESDAMESDDYQCRLRTQAQAAYDKIMARGILVEDQLD